MGHWTRWMRDKEVESNAKDIQSICDRVVKLERQLNRMCVCIGCGIVYVPVPSSVVSCGGFVHEYFDNLTKEYCSRCRPERLRAEELAEWARNHPDEATECKKKHDKTFKMETP